MYAPVNHKFEENRMLTQFDESSPDYRVFNEIIKLRQDFLGMPQWGHPRYSIYDYPQRLCLLSDMNRVYTLRELGDMPKFLELENAINKMPGKGASPQDTCILDMTNWTLDTINTMKVHKTASMKQKVIITLLVYGESYTQKCLDIMFKSLMTEGNLPSLCRHKTVIFHVQTDNIDRFDKAPIIQKIKDLGAHFEYVEIPDELMKQIDSTSVYWLIGAAATIGIEYARKNNASYHHCYPDIVYSNNFFAELLRLTKLSPSILAPAHRSDENVLLPSIKPYENDDCISVPSPDLVALGLNAIHMCHWPTIVNNRPGNWSYPQSHTLIWETHHFVHFNCPHLNAWWLSAEAIEKIPQRFYISLDSELDFLCEGENYYIPQENDELYMVEFSNQGKQKVEDIYTDASNYASYFWKLSTNRDNFKFFIRGMKQKINRFLRPAKSNILDEASCMNEKVFLINMVQSRDPGVGTTLSRPRTHLNKIYGISAVPAKV